MAKPQPPSPPENPLSDQNGTIQAVNKDNTQREDPGEVPTPKYVVTGRRSPRLGDLGNFWNSVDRWTDDYDKDMLEALKSNMDSLLICAALFSAVNSAVIALSVPMLSADTGEETNRLLRLLLQRVENTTSEDLGPPSFSPPADGILINQLFSASLTCSMLAAFGALLGQQWITSYKRRPPGGFEEERRERQRRLIGAKRWRLEPVLELILPMLLQVSLIIFLVGMANYLQSLSSAVALPSAVMCWVGAGFFIFTVIFALSDPHCPFKTPFSEASGSILTTIHTLLQDHYWYSVRMPKVWSHQFGHLARNFKTQSRRWYLRKWPKELLEAQSIRRILSTSSDSDTLREVALNLPLLKTNEAASIIYADNVALSHLYQLYETQSMQSSADEAIYSTALTHLVLGAGEGNPERTSHFLGGRELQIVLNAAHGHLSSPSNPVSFLPSSIMTVALAFLLSDQSKDIHLPHEGPTQQRYLGFLRQSFHSTPTSDIPIIATAWILISSPTFTPGEEKMKKVREDLGFHPATLQSGADLLCSASEAYRTFYTPSGDDVHRFSDAGLQCIIQAIDCQQPPTEEARPVLEGLLHDLAEVITAGMEVQIYSTQSLLVDAVIPLLADDGIGAAAAKLMVALLRRFESDARTELVTSGAINGLKDYSERTPGDHGVKRWLEGHAGTTQNHVAPADSEARSSGT